MSVLLRMFYTSKNNLSSRFYYAIYIYFYDIHPLYVVLQSIWLVALKDCDRFRRSCPKQYYRMAQLAMG